LTPWFIDAWKKTGVISTPRKFNSVADSPSGSVALCTFRLLSSFSMPPSVILMVDQTVPKTQSDVGALSRARTIALLKAADGLTYSDPTSYANMLNSQFSSIFNSNETNDSIKPMGNQIYPEKSTINITEGGIKAPTSLWVFGTVW
jgi:hypothetical protein